MVDMHVSLKSRYEFAKEVICIKKIYSAVSISAAITAMRGSICINYKNFWISLKEALPNSQVNTFLGALCPINNIKEVVFITQKMYLDLLDKTEYQYTLESITVLNKRSPLQKYKCK